MATTTTDQIKSNLEGLGFDNPSDVATYNKIAQGVGIPIDNTITELRNSENTILQIITTQRYGKSGYYTGKALAFQYGDNLVIDPVTLEYVYNVINPLNQIIKQAAFEDLGAGQLFLKVATVNALTGDLQALSTPQLDAFLNYFVNYELPGLPISKVSAAPNILNFAAAATYFATYDLSVLQTNLDAGFTSFRQSFAFNGELFMGDLQAYLRANVPGLRDIYFYNTSIDNTPFGGSIKLDAGYFNYNPGKIVTYAAV